MVGAGIDHPTFDINRMVLNELTVTGSFVYDLDGFAKALEMLASDGFPCDLLIEPGEVALDGIASTLESLASGRIAGKVMVVPEVGGLMAKGVHPYYPSGNPRFNHVAMSLPADLLGEENRRDICRFFKEVLGFDEIEVMTQDRRRLILSCVHWDQFIFLIAEDDPMRCPRMDHYGFAVGTLDELRGIQERAEAFREARRPARAHRPARRRPGSRQDPLPLRQLSAPDDVRNPVLGVPTAGAVDPRWRQPPAEAPFPARYGAVMSLPIPPNPADTPDVEMTRTPPPRRSGSNVFAPSTCRESHCSCRTLGMSARPCCSSRSVSKRWPRRAAGSPPHGGSSMEL